MLAKLILIVFILLAGIRLFYLLYYFARLSFYKQDALSPSTEAVSVVICARNELENLKENLPLILSQDYPNFEVILVNDRSDDESAKYLSELEERHPSLKVIHIKKDHPKLKGKKAALVEGVNEAKHENLLFTDADCWPNSKEWISNMMATKGEGNNIVLGYAPFQSGKKFINLFSQYENVFVAFQYISFALAGKAYMGVGRNLLYPKSSFNPAVYEQSIHLKSGDDDLMLNKIADSHVSKVSIMPQSFMFSKSEESFRAWFRQKKRHISTGNHYKLMDKLKLGLLHQSIIWYTLLLIVLLSLNIEINLVLSIYVLVIGIKFLVFTPFLVQSNQIKWLAWLPILDFLYVIYLILLSPYLFLTSNSTWK